MLGLDYPLIDDLASYRDCLSWIDAVEGSSQRDRAFLSYHTFDHLYGCTPSSRYDSVRESVLYLPGSEMSMYLI